MQHFQEKVGEKHVEGINRLFSQSQALARDTAEMETTPGLLNPSNAALYAYPPAD